MDHNNGTSNDKKKEEIETRLNQRFIILYNGSPPQNDKSVIVPGNQDSP